MSIFLTIYTELLWRPLFNGLIWFYTVLPVQDIGLAIIALTVVIRLLLAPLLSKGQRAQADLARIQPELNRIRDQHKNNREAQARAQMELFTKHKVNPLSGCITLLIQLPILIALFNIFRSGFDVSELTYLYPFITNPGMIDPVSFGVLNLANGNVYLGVAAAVTQYFQTKLMIPPPVAGAKKNDFASMFQKQMVYLFPIFILLWSRSLPSALILHWTISNIIGIVQTIWMNKRVGVARSDIKTN
jgi:YidC/Oxa1 family membrane protein insertase